MKLRYTHLAMTVPRATFTDDFVRDVIRFYKSVFGWKEIPSLRIEGERLTLYTSARAYINIRASNAPMVTSGYEHLGFAVESHEQLRELHARLKPMAADDARVVLSPLNDAVGGEVYSFRVMFLLPVALEIQYFPS